MSNTFTSLEVLNAFTASLPATGFFLSSCHALAGGFENGVDTGRPVETVVAPVVTVFTAASHPRAHAVGVAAVEANGSHGSGPVGFFAHGVDAVEAAAVEAAFASMPPAVFAAFVAHVGSGFDWPSDGAGVDYAVWAAAQGFGSTVDGAAGRYCEALGETLLGD